MSSSRAGSVVDDNDLHNDSVVEDDDIDQLVIQDSTEDVVQYDDEDGEDDEVALDTCVVQMGEDEEEDEAVAVARVVGGNGEGEREGREEEEEEEEDEEGCGDYLMISREWMSSPLFHILTSFPGCQDVSSFILIGQKNCHSLILTSRLSVDVTSVSLGSSCRIGLVLCVVDEDEGLMCVCVCVCVCVPVCVYSVLLMRMSV